MNPEEGTSPEPPSSSPPNNYSPCPPTIRAGGPTRSSQAGWTKEEDERLIKAVQQYQRKNWKKIAELCPGRDHSECNSRWQKVLNPELVKTHWTAEEDALLVKAVNDVMKQKDSLCDTKWASEIAPHVPGRTPKQCRERWTNHLDPVVSREPWSEKEEVFLVKKHEELGNKWAEMRRYFPNRSDNAIKNKWNSIKGRWENGLRETFNPRNPISAVFLAVYEYEQREIMKEENENRPPSSGKSVKGKAKGKLFEQDRLAAMYSSAEPSMEASDEDDQGDDSAPSVAEDQSSKALVFRGNHSAVPVPVIPAAYPLPSEIPPAPLPVNAQILPAQAAVHPASRAQEELCLPSASHRLPDPVPASRAAVSAPVVLTRGVLHSEETCSPVSFVEKKRRRHSESSEGDLVSAEQAVKDEMAEGERLVSRAAVVGLVDKQEIKVSCQCGAVLCIDQTRNKTSDSTESMSVSRERHGAEVPSTADGSESKGMGSYGMNVPLEVMLAAPAGLQAAAEAGRMVTQVIMVPIMCPAGLEQSASCSGAGQQTPPPDFYFTGFAWKVPGNEQGISFDPSTAGPAGGEEIQRSHVVNFAAMTSGQYVAAGAPQFYQMPMFLPAQLMRPVQEEVVAIQSAAAAAAEAAAVAEDEMVPCSDTSEPLMNGKEDLRAET